MDTLYKPNNKRTTKLVDNYIQDYPIDGRIIQTQLYSGLPHWWTYHINSIIIRTTPLVDVLYKPNNIQDYPIGGHIMACKLLSLELHTLFGVSYGRYILHGLYLNVDKSGIFDIFKYS